MKPMSEQYITDPKSIFSEHKLQRIERIISSNAGLENCILMGGRAALCWQWNEWLGKLLQKDKNRFAGLFNISLYSLFFKTGEEDRCDKDEILRLPRPPIIPLGRRFPPALDWWHHQPPTQALIPTQPLHLLSLNPSSPSSPSSVTANSSQSIAHPLDLPQSSLTTNTVFAEHSFLNTFVVCLML